MKNIGEELGVQSYCFRGFKENDEVVRCVKESGLSRIEICGVHADFSDESTFQSVIDTYRNAGIEIVSIGVQAMTADEAKEEKFFDFVKAAGAKHMAVDFKLPNVPDAYRMAEKLAEKYDIRLSIHNHGGRHWLGSSAMLDHVFKNTSERIGLCLDTAWALDSHEDPIAMMEKFADRLYGLHLKDFVFGRDGKPEDVVVGTGNLDLAKALQLAGENDKVGYAVLEYEGDVDNPVPAMKKCVDAVRKEA